MRSKYFTGGVEYNKGLDKNTILLIRDILTKRSNRLSGMSKPQTANPAISSAREYEYNSVRPETSPYGNGINQNKRIEEHFPSCNSKENCTGLEQ